MARNQMRALAHSATTLFQDIATLAQQMQNQPHVHSQIFVGALQGLPDAQTLPAYVNAYFQLGQLQPRQLLNLLTRFLGERLVAKRDWFPYTNDAKFRALVQALPAGAIDAGMRNRLLEVAAGTQNGQIADATGPGWEMRRMHSVLAMFGGQRFGLSVVYRAMENTYFHLSWPLEEHEARITERIQVLTQLVALLPPACAPAHPNHFPAVHRTCNKVLQDMYDQLLWQYVTSSGYPVPENSEFFVHAFRDTIRVFTNAGITLGHQPEGSMAAPNDVADFHATNRLVSSINIGISDLEQEQRHAPQHSQRLEDKRAFAFALLAQIPP